MAPVDLNANMTVPCTTFAPEGQMDLSLCPCSQWDYINCGLVILCILLLFYALALWDRYLELKMRELRALTRERIAIYGSTGYTTPIHYVRTPKTSFSSDTAPFSKTKTFVTHNDSPTGLLAPPPQHQ
ncbi:hypothetical protein CYLTODRAFT_410537 [Cylindrobasidium torrendii FP15055 ss-10]|uniref:Uncharacterized protein n=1 Tax=Cylindrobasidium torrendii FP15055 ss-10 TaxID=1314674 RepID=A0A0D7BDD4_9AGAR|nr:hypothetical protein CYLTODRAFT_410537 [Cylindrobasidium torrendii FP15055 ss-10]